MDFAGTLERIEKMLMTGDDRTAMGVLARAVEQLAGEPHRVRARAVDLLAARLGELPFGPASKLAIAGGALVEAGVGAEPLGRAIVAPLTRALAAATRFCALVDEETQRASRERAGEEDENQDEAQKNEGSLSPEMMRALTEKDPEAVDAFQSLAVWYRPAVATWTRAPNILTDVRASEPFRSSLRRVGRSSEGSYWLSILLEATHEDPFVVLIPELGEAYSMTLDGVVDCGQLSVLLGEALADPLQRIGATERPSPEILEVMRGSGPQQLETARWPAAFHLYSWQAVNPATGMPEDKRFEWLAPGGSGNHSLPADFQPRAIAPLEGARVVVLVGPNAPGGIRFVRLIGASRMFTALKASLNNLRALTHQENEAWARVVREATGE